MADLILPPPRTMTVLARPSLLRAEPLVVGEVPVGLTLAEIVVIAWDRAGIPMSSRTGAIIQINGEIIPTLHWTRVRPKESAHVVVSVGLHGGKILRTVLSIAVMVVAAVVAAPIAAAIAPALGISTGIVAAVATGVISMVGNMAINALFPASTAASTASSTSSDATTYTDKNIYSASAASNQASPGGVVPLVLGKIRFTPPLLAPTYTEVIGDDQYFRMLLCAGIGPVKLEAIEIGGTPIADYAGVDVQIYEGWASDPVPTLYAAPVVEDSLSIKLTQASGWVVRETAEDAEEIGLQFVMPNGCVAYTYSTTRGSSRTTATVSFEIMYAPAGTESWVSRPTQTVTENTTSAVRPGDRWTVPKGKYRVACRRLTADQPETTSSTSNTVYDTLVWSALRTFRSGAPYHPPYPIAVIALRIKATDQLNGTIPAVTVLGTGYAPSWNGSSWSWAPTNNPADIARWLLLGPACVDHPSSVIDTAYAEFHDWCAAMGITFNKVCDDQVSLPARVRQVLASAMATQVLPDCRESVIWDRSDLLIMGHHTPLNSWDYEITGTFARLPHGLRVKYYDENNNYAETEAYVYRNGYSSANATIIEAIEFEGVTNHSQACRLGLYHFAQIILRPNTHTYTIGWDALGLYKGALIRFAHDVPKIGSSQARVKAVIEEDGRLVGVTLDDICPMEAGKVYACRFRDGDSGASIVVTVITDPGGPNTIRFSAPRGPTEGPSVGDLAMFGEADRESAPLIVKSLEWQGIDSVTVTAVDYAPEIWGYVASGTIPAYDPRITKSVDITAAPPPIPWILGIESGTIALEVLSSGVFRARAFVSLELRSGAPAARAAEVRYRPVGTTRWDSVTGAAGAASVTLADVVEGVRYEIQARGMSAYGVASAWGDTALHTIVGQSEPPPNVTGLAVSIVGPTAHFSWDAVPLSVVDLDHFEIRRSPLIEGASWVSSVPWGGRISRGTTTTTGPALIGTYLIKAFDHAGNESRIAGSAITNVAKIAGLNVVETFGKSGSLLAGGSGSSVVYDLDGYLRLSGIGLISEIADLSTVPDLSVWGGVAIEGTWTFSDIVDLEGVFTARVTASLSVAVVDTANTIDKIEDLSKVTDLSGEVSGGSVILDMSTTLDDPAGSPAWSDWAPFSVGDITARAWRFRARLGGRPPAITPRVWGVAVSIDMADRVVAVSTTIPIGGARVSYAPAFFARPAWALSVGGGIEGDRFAITGEDESGFHIAFENGGVGVSREISVIAKGYGEAA